MHAGGRRFDPDRLHQEHQRVEQRTGCGLQGLPSPCRHAGRNHLRWPRTTHDGRRDGPRAPSQAGQMRRFPSPTKVAPGKPSAPASAPPGLPSAAPEVRLPSLRRRWRRGGSGARSRWALAFLARARSGLLEAWTIVPIRNLRSAHRQRRGRLVAFRDGVGTSLPRSGSGRPAPLDGAGPSRRDRYAEGRHGGVETQGGGSSRIPGNPFRPATSPAKRGIPGASGLLGGRAGMSACPGLAALPQYRHRRSHRHAARASAGKPPDGAQGRNRTADTGIFSPLLYRLSYLGRGRGGL